jgi:hypothetical protein
MSSSRALSVVVAVRNGSLTLSRALAAILASDLPRDAYELIVVDDASSDGSAELAARYADTVVRLTGRKSGPGYARNRGAELAQGEVLVFVDADVMVQPHTLAAILTMLSDHPELAAMATSHDQAATAPNLVSQYWNLLLNFGDQRETGTSGNFASPCAAIRRHVFLSIGMYDEWRFGAAALEGIELGTRLAASACSVLSRKDLTITGLRRWNVRSICREVWNRSALLAQSLGYQRTRAAVPSDVVFTLSRSLAPVVALMLLGAVSAASLPRPDVMISASVVLLGAIAINLRASLFFAKARGIYFAIAVAPLHLLMQATSGVGLCAGWLLRDAVGDRAPDAAMQAYSEVGVETWPPVPRATGS